MTKRETSTSRFVPRTRKVRILATLGPASHTPEMVRQLAEAGADAFRVNMSHGTHAEKICPAVYVGCSDVGVCGGGSSGKCQISAGFQKRNGGAAGTTRPSRS